MEQFDSVKTLIENLRSENAEQRLSSMRGIHLIATTLGPERTRDELLLYLTDYLDDSDDVLRVFASALGTMLPEVGGMAYITSLLKPLEMLSGLDEITVRDEGVAALQTLGEQVFAGAAPASSSGGGGGGVGLNHVKAGGNDAVAKAQSEYMAMIFRLGTGTPQCRSSACGLIATAYAHGSSATRSSLLKLFLDLCADKEIMVRRAACVAMGKSVVAVLGAKGANDLVPALGEFTKDSSDGVRLQAVSTFAPVLRVLPVVQHGSILQAIRSLAADGSWRVRYMVADCLGDLAAAVAPPDVTKYIVPTFRGLCQDAEAEIRASTVCSMAKVLAACRDAGAKKDVLVTGTRLVSDASPHVRMSLAGAVLKSVAHVAKELWATTIVPTCTALLSDAEADVRLALVSGFSSMGDTAEAKELAPKLIPVIITLATDPKWRLREVVVSQVPYIITSLGQSAEEVLEVCLERVTDRVATIRDAAVQSCCKLFAEHGADWASKKLLPRLGELAKDENYLHRVTLCRFYVALANVMAFDSALCASAVWPVVQQLAEDPIVNVRMNATRVVIALQKANKAPAREATALLQKLQKDAVEDVRDVAMQITKEQ